jgi:hypothetical protein
LDAETVDCDCVRLYQDMPLTPELAEEFLPSLVVG